MTLTNSSQCDSIQMILRPGGQSSLLNDIMGNIPFERPLLRFSFPVEWSKVVIQGAKAMGNGGPMLSMVPNLFSQSESGWGQPPPLSHGIGGDNLAHVHPDIRSAMQEYHERFTGQVAGQELLEAANLMLKELPYLTNLVDAAGKNWFCWGFANMEGAVSFDFKMAM